MRDYFFAMSYRVSDKLYSLIVAENLGSGLLINPNKFKARRVGRELREFIKNKMGKESGCLAEVIAFDTAQDFLELYSYTRVHFIQSGGY